jgi:metal-sulfur cluster biosynthetic enzyme
LGFIKQIPVEDEQIHIRVVLSVPSCPLARILRLQVRGAAQSVAPDAKVTVELLDEPWTPPWEGVAPD